MRPVRTVQWEGRDNYSPSTLLGNNEKVNSNKLFCTLKISKGLIEYVQKKIKFFLSQS